MKEVFLFFNVLFITLCSSQGAEADPLPSDCWDTGDTITRNGVTVSLLECIIDNSLPKACSVLMPNYDDPSLTDTQINLVNRIECATNMNKETFDITEGKSFENCFQLCLNYEGFECRSVHTIMAGGQAGQCYETPCSGPNSVDAGDLKELTFNTKSNLPNRAYWFKNKELCLDYIENGTPSPTGIPTRNPTPGPTNAPTHRPTTAEPTPQPTGAPTFESGYETGDIAVYYAPSIDGYSLGTSNIIGAEYVANLEECADMCTNLVTCMGFAFMNQELLCRVYSDFTESMLEPLANSVTYEKLSQKEIVTDSSEGLNTTLIVVIVVPVVLLFVVCTVLYCFRKEIKNLIYDVLGIPHSSISPSYQAMYGGHSSVSCLDAILGRGAASTQSPPQLGIPTL